jgi:hypothetical protein
MKTFDWHWKVSLNEQGMVVRQRFSQKLFVSSNGMWTEVWCEEALYLKYSAHGIAQDVVNFHYCRLAHHFSESLLMWKVDGHPIFYSVASDNVTDVLADNLTRVGLDKLFG